jgi:chemotaxis signal transduction protein
LAELDNDVATEVPTAQAEEDVRICLFTIGSDTYAIPVYLLLEIIIPQKIFPVPNTPAHVLGVINLRGTIVPIVDIRPVLALQVQTAPGQIAIIRYGSMTLGIVVNNVTAVLGLPPTSIQTLPAETGTPQVNTNRSRFLSGIIQLENGVAALLNIERIIEEIKLT